MSEFTELLRDDADFDRTNDESRKRLIEAADHIEKLEAALHEITQRPAYAMDIAREALKKNV